MRVSCTGCSLADLVYAKIDFNSVDFQHYLSQTDGDGGLNPGHLVFTEDLEKFAGKQFRQILAEIAPGASPDAFNLGGPAIVALVNAAQLCPGADAKFNFFGNLGQDENTEKIINILQQTPVDIANYCPVKGVTPNTVVLSDPGFHDGKGERTFINNIGAAWQYTPEQLGENFFAADIVVFGGTALVPVIHDNLTALLKKGKAHGCVNIVTTVFDFRNEKKHAGRQWPLGESDDSYQLIDLLIMDWVEAMRLSAADKLDDAVNFFISKGANAFIITHGPEPYYLWSNGAFFKPQPLTALPVSSLVGERLSRNPELKGDTTGCGDNFAGGVLASTTQQLQHRQPGNLDLIEACSWGCASGGFACFYVGGTYLEKNAGEKLAKVGEFQQAYMQQIAALI
jgi:sugar/nucleoside kinase (ribokinase family)